MIKFSRHYNKGLFNDLKKVFSGDSIGLVNLTSHAISRLSERLNRAEIDFLRTLKIIKLNAANLLFIKYAHVGNVKIPVGFGYDIHGPNGNIHCVFACSLSQSDKNMLARYGRSFGVKEAGDWVLLKTVLTKGRSGVYSAPMGVSSVMEGDDIVFLNKNP